MPSDARRDKRDVTRPPVALVTGGAKRLGASIARLLAARGCQVAIHCNTSLAEAEGLAAEIGDQARVFQADLGVAGSPRLLVERVMQSFGALDVLINSAASFHRTPLTSVTEAQWDEVFAVNLRAPFFLALEASRVMTVGGCIVNMSDLAAFETWPGYIPHGIAKAGVATMTRNLARQLAPDIRVNAIAPGVVLLPDDMPEAEVARLAETTPLRRHGSPDDITRAVEYLLDARFVTGEVLFVDGGRHVRR